MITRRTFLAGASSCAVLGGLSGAEVPSGRETLRFLVASDIHFRPGVFPHDTREWTERIVARGTEARVDFGLQLGDFIHDVKASADVIACWHKAPYPTYSVLGNHDDDGSSPEETRAALGLASGWYRFEAKGWRFLVLDTNYALVDGKFIHYGKGCGFTYYKLPVANRMRLHPDELVWLKAELESAAGPVAICSHVKLMASHPDAKAVSSLVAAANARRPGTVRLMLSGHNHADRFEVRDGIVHMTVNSPNHCWVKKKHTAYPQEDVRRWREIDHVIAYATPLSAVVELGVDGSVRVEGMKGEFWRGLSPSVMGIPAKGITASIENHFFKG